MYNCYYNNNNKKQLKLLARARECMLLLERLNMIKQKIKTYAFANRKSLPIGIKHESAEIREKKKQETSKYTENSRTAGK